LDGASCAPTALAAMNSDFPDCPGSHRRPRGTRIAMHPASVGPGSSGDPSRSRCTRDASVDEQVGVRGCPRLGILLGEEAGGERAGPLLSSPRATDEVLTGDTDFTRPDARIPVQEGRLDLAGRVVRRLIRRIGGARAVGGPWRQLDEALLA